MPFRKVTRSHAVAWCGVRAFITLRERRETVHAMKCRQCMSDLAARAAFCHECGAPNTMRRSEPAAPASVPPVSPVTVARVVLVRKRVAS